MKKIIIVVIIVLISLILIGNISFSANFSELSGNVENSFTKNELYKMMIENNVNLKDRELIYILTHWYYYFDREDMFLTQDGEYVDFVTYEIYRVHLENYYKNDSNKILKKMLKYNNFPKQENSEKYDQYINEYKRTTGKDI